MHFRVRSKRGKVRFVPVHAMAQRLIEEYLALAGHGTDAAGPVFGPVTNNQGAGEGAQSQFDLPQHRPEIWP